MTKETNKYEDPYAQKATIKGELKKLGTGTLAVMAGSYVTASLILGTPNFTRWPEIYKQEMKKEIQKRDTLIQKETDLYFKLYNLIDKNNDNGIEIKEFIGHLERTIETGTGTDGVQRSLRIRVLERMIKELENKGE